MIEPIATGGEELALFPLRSVLLPGARMALQIFEPRYLDLVSHCMKNDCGFGIVRITEGHEIILAQGSEPPATARVGTLARIVDWDALPGGRLRITIEGGRRFRVASRAARAGSVAWPGISRSHRARARRHELIAGNS